MTLRATAHPHLAREQASWMLFCGAQGRFGLQSNDPLSLGRRGLSADGDNRASAASQPGIPRTRKSVNPCPRREAEVTSSACLRSASY